MKINKELIPIEKPTMDEFLKTLAHELNTQDNRIKAYPLFCVQVKRRVYGEKMCQPNGSIWSYEDHVLDSGEELKEYFLESIEYYDEKDQEKIKEFDPDWDTEILDYTKYKYEESWEFNTAHLTEKAAQLYINQNKHNLNDPRIYVTSQYRCHEFNVNNNILLLAPRTNLY